MKKIGIITINDFNNYGNRLQCYAVQCCLESMGYLGENIYNTYSRDGFIVNSGRKIIRKLRSFRRRNIVAVRKQNFTEFNQNIRFSKDRIINGRFDKDLSDRYDFFITGSDQVWNPYDSGRSEIDFLTFASEEKRISFSASMGVEKIPDQMREKYREYLKDYHRISVREETAKMIIEELIGRTDIEVLVNSKRVGKSVRKTGYPLQFPVYPRLFFRRPGHKSGRDQKHRRKVFLRDNRHL